MHIADSVALITGGASGLGEACARNLVELGAKVAVLDFAEERGREIASQLGNNAIYCKTDVSDEKAV